MSWWGKLVGGTVGFMFAGPLGAMLGAAVGHRFDSGLNNFSQTASNFGDTERIQAAFFTATFSIMGHLAKADGNVSEDEIAVARRVMNQMNLSPEQMKSAMFLFGEGKKPDFPLDDVLNQFRRECQDRHNLVQIFVEFLIVMSLADGTLAQEEKTVLNYVCEQLGFSSVYLEQLLERVQAYQRYEQQDRRVAGHQKSMPIQDAYAILGLDNTADEEEVKRAYRKLMNQHHPDKLVAKGLPEEMMKIATEKTQDIKAAYERIKIKLAD